MTLSGGHTQGVHGVSFNPESTRVVTASVDGSWCVRAPRRPSRVCVRSNTRRSFLGGLFAPCADVWITPSSPYPPWGSLLPPLRVCLFGENSICSGHKLFGPSVLLKPAPPSLPPSLSLPCTPLSPPRYLASSVRHTHSRPTLKGCYGTPQSGTTWTKTPARWSTTPPKTP